MYFKKLDPKLTTFIVVEQISPCNQMKKIILISQHEFKEKVICHWNQVIQSSKII